MWLKVAPVKITRPRSSVSVYVLSDERSTVTIIDADVAEKIGVSGPPNPLHLLGLNGILSECFVMRNVRSVKDLQLPYQVIVVEGVKIWPHLADVPLMSAVDGKPKLLIG